MLPPTDYITDGHDTAPNGPNPIDLHLVINDRWCALDLDELRDSIQAAGLPPELIVTYTDQHRRRAGENVDDLFPAELANELEELRRR